MDEIKEGKFGTTWEELEWYLYEVPINSIYTFKWIGDTHNWVASITLPFAGNLRVQGEGKTIADALTNAVTAALTIAFTHEIP